MRRIDASRLRDATCLVTGGAGFIGSHLVDALLEAGARVRVLDDFSTGERAKLAHRDREPRLSVVEGSVLDPEALGRCSAGADWVFHLATRNVRLSLRRPTEVHECNTTGTLEVLKAAAAARARRMVYVSSSEVNGTAGAVPMAEEYPYRPETIYGASKLAGEYYAGVFHRAGWLETVVARPHNTYGPREHHDGLRGEVIPRFIVRALAGLAPQVYGDGGQTRDFTYVTETAEAIRDLALCEAAAGQTVNVCRGEEVSVLRIAQLVARSAGSGVEPVFLPARPSDVRRLYGDNERMRTLLGRTPRVGIEEGISRTVAWFRAHLPDPAAAAREGPERGWEAVGPEPWLGRLAKGSRP